MAKKETTKKKTTKKVAKKLEEQAPIEVQEFEEAIEMMDAALEVVEETKVEPEDMGPAEIEVMNGDPAVVTPVNDVPLMENPVTGELTPAEPLREKQEEEPAGDTVEEVPEEEIKPKKSVFKRMFGYIWNGQEMDY